MPLSWDDFRLVKAIADRGGLTNAAAALGINHSTAFRRLARIEASVDARLFERARTGYVVTPAGVAMVDAATRMEADVAGFGLAVAGQALAPSGTLRVTAPATFVSGLLMPLLARFRARFPAITLDMIVSEDALNLSRREADVAFRATNNPSANLSGRRLAGIAWAIYGLREQTYGDLRDCDWIGLAPDVGGGLMARFVTNRTDPDRIVMQFNGVLGLSEAVQAGIGIGPLPCLTGDANAQLRRLSEPLPDLAASLWLLTHPDLRHSARVRAIMDFTGDAITPFRPALEGRGARSS